MDNLNQNNPNPNPNPDQPEPGRGPSESVKSNAKTVIEAIEKGLAQLNLTRDEVDVSIINQGSRGILGLGAEEAVVMLTPKPSPPDPDLPPPGEAADATPPPSGSSDEADPFTPEIKARAQEILETLLSKLSVKANVSVRIGTDLVEPGENPPLTLDVTGSDLGLLIGRRGETLQALHFVTRQILNKEVGQWVPVVVDVESYLTRRRKSLQQLANRMAERVVFSRKKMALEPMSPQERRIIHLQLREHEQVYTNSTGEGDKRKVVIFPK
ncbi:MAG: RNA-binding cell elongation regulator Jag/EloR [Anaerolineae bacterium]